MLLGSQLRRLREEHGVARAEAAEALGTADSTVSRMELGRVALKETNVAVLLTLYGVDDEEERAAFLARVRETNTQCWWHPYSDVTPNWLQRYLGLEATASVIRTYEAQWLPGLLQTEAYAEALIRLGTYSQRDDEVARRVRLRLERQQVLSQPDPPTLWAVIDEAALRRPVGGPRVMRDQIEALAVRESKNSKVMIQVMPLAAGGHAGAGTSFTILRFPQKEMRDLVYVEQLTSALYLDKPADIDCYFDVMNRLSEEAATPQQTPEILDRILADLGRAA
ncbi:helix-turn-helix domain-containing protein [Actinoplanes sp. LDG1-01]|uniref:Helix-turn-helix domain-containing protein n=1 Tax=Paractinoplanes lichenicola TaxID=2802976 RepID=A0ABS1VNN9_9ACTN|nr:helix-turn-helix domain-containing protein [Actinoplanes lichenicola]